VTDEDYVAFVLEEMTPTQEAWIERHLATCASCTQALDAFFAATAAFPQAASEQQRLAWVQQVRARLQAAGLSVPVPPPEEAWEPVALATALQQAQQQVDDPAWRARLARWQTHWAGKAQAAVRLVVEQAARVVTEGLEALTTPGNRWDFALVSESARVLGEDRDVSQGTAEPRPEAPQVSIQVGQASREATRRIRVSVRALPAQPVPPLVLLIPATAGGVPQMAALAPRQGSAWFVADFRNVPQGDYLLAFEPMEDINPP
jgi:hypothetical protein